MAINVGENPEKIVRFTAFVEKHLHLLLFCGIVL